MIRSHVLYPAELLVLNEAMYIPYLERMGKGILHLLTISASVCYWLLQEKSGNVRKCSKNTMFLLAGFLGFYENILGT